MTIWAVVPVYLDTQALRLNQANTIISLASIKIGRASCRERVWLKV